MGEQRAEQPLDALVLQPWGRVLPQHVWAQARTHQAQDGGAEETNQEATRSRGGVQQHACATKGLGQKEEEEEDGDKHGLGIDAVSPAGSSYARVRVRDRPTRNPRPTTAT